VSSLQANEQVGTCITKRCSEQTRCKLFNTARATEHGLKIRDYFNKVLDVRPERGSFRGTDRDSLSSPKSPDRTSRPPSLLLNDKPEKGHFRSG
jgi:hypothetical protein